MSIHRIRCSHCADYHASVFGVRNCAQGNEVSTCSDLVWVARSEDGEPIYRECGADIAFDGRASRCASGHENISMEAMAREGLVYAESDAEALGLVRYGFTPLDMGGNAYPL